MANDPNQFSRQFLIAKHRRISFTNTADAHTSVRPFGICLIYSKKLFSKRFLLPVQIRAESCKLDDFSHVYNCTGTAVPTPVTKASINRGSDIVSLCVWNQQPPGIWRLTAMKRWLAVGIIIQIFLSYCSGQT